MATAVPATLPDGTVPSPPPFVPDRDRRAYGGDSNFDGKIDTDDYGSIDFNILVPGASGYANGDFITTA